MTRSEELYARALRVSPGGVHSPVRAFRSVGGTPVFMTGGHGATLRDVDGREYLDFCMAFGPLILGHAHAGVRAAVDEALSRGWSLGTAEPYSLELAEFITSRIPWVESLRFVNSGTEAVMSALRVARAATGRSTILKFEGCYHGHADAMLLRAGSGLADAPQPDSAGLGLLAASETLVAPLDDEASLEAMFAQHGARIACAIIEPLPANYGLLPQRREFLQRLAHLARQHGALLIFDEVISGFRVGFQGYAPLAGVTPDLVTYGKIIGGGFPVGAYGGRRELMQLVAPVGPVYQAGTLSANPVAMCAGLAMLRALADGAVYAQLEARGAQLERELAGVPGLIMQRHGSLFWLCLAGARSAPPAGAPAVLRSPRQYPEGCAKRFAEIYHPLLARGIYLAPSGFEVGFLSAAHTGEHVSALASAIRSVCAAAAP
ncbi:MAG TPA: glutamate-1-semialdehyde 2,1-aminomutase [Steroidobacteraceae bacterium]|nr:glutamate-1-semialdehyde 2,1-aminomutase [Steroidobacteraceae bacterium]